jgi:transglutaminase-like putative cysteine protease
MLLKLTHSTNLTYSDLISESVMELRMAPRQEMDQHRLSFSLAIGPPTTALSYFDWLGNTVHSFTVNGFHKQIRIVATSVVQTEARSEGIETLPDTWPIDPDAYDYTNYDYLQFGGPVVESAALQHLVDVVRPEPGTPLVHLAWRILGALNTGFQYRAGVTTAASPITDMLEHGYGVCQDFTHLMIGLGRALNIPSRYVSGLLHPVQERFKGFTQTHAWCELLFPSVGWIGFDAANNCPAGENFVKVAVGRDYRDVPPNRGIYRGSAAESIDVQVHSAELQTVPPELAAEQYQALDVPSYPAGSVGHHELVNQQQAVQQQQEQQQQQ